MFILQVDVREHDDIKWLSNLTMKNRIAGVTSQEIEHDLYTLKVNRGEKLEMVESPDWEDIEKGVLTGSAIEVEIRYPNGYRDYEVRLYKTTSLDKITSNKHGKLPLFKGVIITKANDWQPDLPSKFDKRNYQYGSSNTWWGCYLKGMTMKKEGFNTEAVEWFNKAKSFKPTRLEILQQLVTLNPESVVASELETALENIDLPCNTSAVENLK